MQAPACRAQHPCCRMAHVEGHSLWPTRQQGNRRCIQISHRQSDQPHNQQQPQHWRSVLVCCAAKEDDTLRLPTRRVIPIFPLNMVAMPSALMPLNIFEARYRVLFNTLLAGESDIIEDMVNDQASWAGSRQFGMCLATGQGLASIGTTLRIEKWAVEEDGRMLVTSRGMQRFKIAEVIQAKPILVAAVDILPEQDQADTDDEVEGLANETRVLLRQLLRLQRKMDRGLSEEDSKKGDPDEMEELKPTALSFWVSSLFQNSLLEQQTLLEMTSTQQRLGTLKGILGENVKLLSAHTALQQAFRPASEATASAEPDSSPTAVQPPAGSESAPDQEKADQSESSAGAAGADSEGDTNQPSQ